MNFGRRSFRKEVEKERRGFGDRGRTSCFKVLLGVEEDGGVFWRRFS